MEKLQFHTIHIPLFALLFLLQLSSLMFQSLAYTLPDKYFINCGSATNIIDTGRNFVGDLNTGASISIAGQSNPVTDSNQSSLNTLTLYQTARIFGDNSSYEFDIKDNGTYFVRLHFFAFSSPIDLSTALFDVWTYGFSLLLNFTAKNNSNSPIVKEFLLTIKPSKFNVYFVPRGSSFAFINAIEVFLAPDNSLSVDAVTVTHVSPRCVNCNYTGVLSRALLAIHRINVGGPALATSSDTLWTNWVPDDGYIHNPNTAINSSFYTSTPKYQAEVDKYIAPDLVYKTAKQMNKSSSSNISWSFNVNRSATHLIRVHFCDIISTSLNVLSFNLYIYSNFSQKIDPYEHADQMAVPFHLDYVVDSDDSGFMNISIGPRSDSTVNDAFLNGLEIMEILEKSGSAPTVSRPKNKHVFLVVGSVLGGLVLIICISAVVFFLVLKYRKPKPVETSDWSPVPVHGGGSSHSGLSWGTNMNLGLKIPLAEILFATKNFDTKFLIGKGGFGNVYRGTFRNGTKVAVKRSEPGSGQGLPEFQTEIMVLSKIRHRHLVSLIGYCDERSEMILVYEFMEKGTLRDHLYTSGMPHLSWKQRLEICIGASRGLHYLHRGAAGGIIHRDVKSTNILLDENHVAKVADFGLSRTGPVDDTHVSTTVKGTFGYLDPEYFKSQQLTEKSDVYSFGVVLLEVLCARPAIDIMLPREEVNLAEWGMLCKTKGLLEEIIDPSIKGQIDPNSLRKFIETAEKCLKEEGTDRPSMGDVLWDLEYALQFQQTAVQREPHEDSTTDGSAALILPNAQRFPSSSLLIGRDGLPILREDAFDITASYEVFSQVRIDDSR